MSNSNKGILLVVGGAVLAAVAAGAVYFLVLGPRSEQKRLQNEIEKWGAKWDSARDCLVGPDPHSSDGYEAVVLREALSTGDVVADLAECDEEIKSLRRGEGYSAGQKVEAAWDDSQKKVTALAEAWAWRTGKTPNKPIAELRAALGKAVADVDLAYARLREKADMDAVRRPGERLPTLPAGRVLADARGTPITPDEIGVSGNVVVAAGEIADRKWLIRDAGSGTPQVIPIGAETAAGIDGSGWGAWSETPDEGTGTVEVRSGPVDDLGDPAGDGVLIARLASGETAEARFALAAEPVRIAVYQTFNEAKETSSAWVARSRDGGATWPEKIQLMRSPESGASFQITVDPAQQRADLFFTGDDGAPRWLVIDRASAAGPIAPARAETPASQPCVAGTRTWWIGEDDTIYTGEAPGAPLRPVPGSSEGVNSLFCAGERLLGITSPDDLAAGGQTVLVCRASGCSATRMPAAAGARTVAALGDRHGPLVATEADGVVVIASGDPEKKQDFKPIEIARLAGEQHLAGLVEWNGAVHLVTRTDKTLHIVPVGK